MDPASSPAGRVLRLGVLGCGRFGRALAAGFAATPRVRVVACADTDAAAAQACARALGAEARSPEALCASSEVEAVAVATPNASHRACVLPALAARKHVWCEKPLALTLADCDAMLEAAHRAGVCFTVGHMQRHFPLLAAVREAVAAGAVGTPGLVTLTRREYLRREPGWLRRRAVVGGLQFQSSVHEFDWLRSAFGEVRRVGAVAAPHPLQGYLDFPDALVVTCAFASGCAGALAACMTDFVGAYRGEVDGEAGSLHFDLLAGTYRLGTPDGRVRAVDVSGGPLSAAPAHGGARARADFVAWVLDGTPPGVTAWDGRQAVAIACAVEESLRSGAGVDLEPAAAP